MTNRPTLIDLTGQRFGRLLVVERSAAAKKSSARWVCQCDCGGHTEVYGYVLRADRAKSCGCNRPRLNGSPLKHGMRCRGRTSTERTLARCWSAMLDRCLNPKNSQFHNYGGRGISVCERWLKLENFVADMSPRPPGLTLERIDNDGDYAPGNCRWATYKEQGQNRRTNVKATVWGETLTAAVIAERSGLHKATIARRIHRGLSEADVIASPKHSSQPARRT